MDQDQLNKEMIREGRIRYWRKIQDAKRRNHESLTLHGSAIIRQSLEPMVEELQHWVRSQSHKKAGRNNSLLDIFKDLEYEVLAFITAKVCIDRCGIDSKYTRTCLKVGEAVEDELRFRYLKKKAPILWKRIKNQVDTSTTYARKRAIIVLTMNRNKDRIPFEPLGLSAKARLGATLVEMFLKSTGVCETVLMSMGKKQIKYLVFKPETQDWIDKFNTFREDLYPVWLPTHKQPLDWESPFLGGYDIELFDGCTLVKTLDKEYLVNDLAQASIDDVYESINSLQQTKWRINHRILDVAEYFYSQGLDLPGMPAIRDEEIPAKPEDIATNKESRKIWKLQSRQVYDRNIANRSKRLRVSRTIALAKKFRKQPQFYFPFQLDFRGRAYCMSSYLNPQSDDFGRSLLEFSQGKRMDCEHGEKWLAIHGANVYGYDKVSFEERVNWVRKNEQAILEAEADPLSNLWWSQADKPWQFLAFCFEWARYKKQGEVFITHLPVQIDGTNNGLQLLSILTRDEKSAASTNCLNLPIPADIYQDVADAAKEMLTKDLTNEDDLIKSYAKYWLEYGIDRKTTKRSVMILPYGGTSYSSNEYVESWYKESLEKKNESVEMDDLYLKRVYYLGSIVWKAVNSNVGKPLEAMRWMEKCAKIMAKHSLFLEWTTPLGFPVKQRYVNFKRHMIKTTIGDSIVMLSLRSETDQIDNRRQVNGFSPNFVHSLDASILHKTICVCNKLGISSYNMIHDSFGAHCTEIEAVSAAVRNVVYNMFKDNLLMDLRDKLQGLLPAGSEDLPLPPEYGKFNLDDVMESEYLFS